jgi:hypothetical protein
LTWRRHRPHAGVALAAWAGLAAAVLLQTTIGSPFGHGRQLADIRRGRRDTPMAFSPRRRWCAGERAAHRRVARPHHAGKLGTR